MQKNIKKYISKKTQYVIYTDSQRFILTFTPSDLTRIKNDSCFIINNLQSVYDRRKLLWIENLKKISEMKTFPFFYNNLPDYYNIYEENNILLAESRFYSYETLNCTDETNVFFKKLSAICSFMQNITDKTHSEPIVEADDIIFEKDMPDTMHLLYVDFVSTGKSSLCVQLRNILIKKVFGRNANFGDCFIHSSANLKDFHPEVASKIVKLIEILSPIKNSASSWKSAKEMSCEICRLTELDKDYFVNRYVTYNFNASSINDKIKRGFEEYGHILFLRSDEINLLRKTANGFLNKNKDKYIHSAYCDASEGLEKALEGEAFILHSGIQGADSRLSALRKFDGNTLLIIENCDIENDRLFKKLIRLPFDIIFLSKNDYSEYGFCEITI